jgi:integrase
MGGRSWIGAAAPYLPEAESATGCVDDCQDSGPNWVWESWPRHGNPDGSVRTYEDIARAFGVSVSTVYYWKRQGAPIRRNRTNELESISAWYREWMQKRGGVSIKTSNYYLISFKSFCRWLVRDRRSPENPLAYLSAMNARTDRRVERRHLSAEEFSRFVNAARMGDEFRELNGTDRAMLYLAAAYTGLREGELASLSPANLDLEAELPIVTVEAAYSKHRRRDVLPLHADLARELALWIKRKRLKAEDKLWPGTWRERGGNMVRRDLAKAKVPYRDQVGRIFDFHALRHQFISTLARSGCASKGSPVAGAPQHHHAYNGPLHT